MKANKKLIIFTPNNSNNQKETKMNNIKEILSKQNNYNQKITNIDALCQKGDFHLKYTYNYEVCKNCHSIMHNSCKSQKYCALCIFNAYPNLHRICFNEKDNDIKICYYCDIILCDIDYYCSEDGEWHNFPYFYTSNMNGKNLCQKCLGIRKKYQKIL